jgi:rhodanese-related sulfurtransferase
MITLSRSGLLLIAALLVGCGSVKTSDKDIKRVEYADVMRMLGNAKVPTTLLDVRPRRHYDAEHLPDALHIALPDLVGRDERLATARHIIVYGNDYRDPLSPAAAKKLTVLGYKSVFDFRGGVEAWKAAGGSTVTPAGEDAATSP